MENYQQPGIENNSEKLKLTKDKIQKMVDLFINDDLTVGEISQTFDLEKSQVQQILDEYDVKKGKKNEPGKTIESSISEKSLLPKEILVELYSKRKLPIIEIELMLGTTQYILYKSLEFHGIPRKGRGIYTLPNGRKNSRR